MTIKLALSFIENTPQSLLMIVLSFSQSGSLGSISIVFWFPFVRLYTLAPVPNYPTFLPIALYSVLMLGTLDTEDMTHTFNKLDQMDIYSSLRMKIKEFLLTLSSHGKLFFK